VKFAGKRLNSHRQKETPATRSHSGENLTLSGRGEYMARTVINPDMRVLFILTGLATHMKKRYVYPSQLYICKRMRQMSGRVMSMRTVNRHLASLERDGLIRRQRRITHSKIRGTEFRSTLYHITQLAEKILRPAIESFTKQVNNWANLLQKSRVPHKAHNRISHTSCNPTKRDNPATNPPNRPGMNKVGEFLATARALLKTNH